MTTLQMNTFFVPATKGTPAKMAARHLGSSHLVECAYDPALSLEANHRAAAYELTKNAPLTLLCAGSGGPSGPWVWQADLG